MAPVMFFAKLLRSVVVLVSVSVGLAAESGTSSAQVHHPQLVTVSPPRSIDRSGARDVTDEFNRFIAGLGPHTRIVLPKGATYRVEGSLVLRHKRDLSLVGTGATIVAGTDGSEARTVDQGTARKWLWPRKRVHVLVEDSERVSLVGVQVMGPHVAAGPNQQSYRRELEAQHGIEIYASRSVEVIGCNVRNVFGDGLSISGSSSDISVDSCEVKGTGRQGITIDWADDVSITGSSVGEVGRSTIDLEPATKKWTVTDVAILDNRLGRSHLATLASLGEGEVSRVVFRGNTVTGDVLDMHVRAKADVPRSNWTIARNTADRFHASPAATMRLHGISGLVVAGNVQPIASTQSRHGLEIGTSRRMRVSGNSFPIHRNNVRPVQPTTEQAKVTVDGVAIAQPYVR